MLIPGPASVLQGPRSAPGDAGGALGGRYWGAGLVQPTALCPETLDRHLPHVTLRSALKFRGQAAGSTDSGKGSKWRTHVGLALQPCSHSAI